MFRNTLVLLSNIISSNILGKICNTTKAIEAIEARDIIHETTRGVLPRDQTRPRYVCSE